MKKIHAVQLTAYSGQYSFSVTLPPMSDDLCEQVIASFDDWTEFIEDCLHPVVEFHGSGEKKVLGFTCSMEVVGCDLD